MEVSGAARLTNGKTLTCKASIGFFGASGALLFNRCDAAMGARFGRSRTATSVVTIGTATCGGSPHGNHYPKIGPVDGSFQRGAPAVTE